MYPYSNLRGFDDRRQLQSMDTVQDQPHSFGPYKNYSTSTGKYNTIDPLNTGSCAYRSQQQQTHRKLVPTKPEVRDHIPAASNTLFQVLHFPMPKYTYPTLNFMFNGADLLNTVNDNSSLCEEYEQRISSGKQKEKIHPFYRRQCLATSRDGLTRTRDKYRVVYTDKQKKLLENEYDQTKFLPDKRRAGLAKETELSERQIKFWFQNRRAKDKRKRKTLKRENISSRPTSDKHSLSKDIQRVESDCKTIKETEEIITSCEFTSQKCFSEQIAFQINDDQVIKQTNPSTYIEKDSPGFTSSCIYSKQQPSLPSTYGTCRFERKEGSSKEGTSSSVGCQYFCQYPVSPSEWTMANQRPYLVNGIAVSPLVNGLHYGFDHRL